MNIDLDDDQTRALLNVLIEVIEADRYPLYVAHSGSWRNSVNQEGCRPTSNANRAARRRRPWRCRAARNRNSSQKLGASPASRLATEYQAIEIISGSLRPTRSASQPEAVAPRSRIHKVIVNTAVTSTSGTSKSLAIGAMISRKIVKSNASRTQPSHAAIQACNCSRLGSFHHATGVVISAASAILFPPVQE